MFESLFFQSLISFEFSFTDFDSSQTFLYVILWRTLNLSSQPDEQSNSFSEIPEDYSVGEGNTLYDLRKIFVRGFSHFSL